MTVRSVILTTIGICLFFLAGCKDKYSTTYLEEGSKKINGTELYYKIIGEGEPIVILHGGPGFEHTYLLPQMGKLADDYKLIFFDQRASGGSEADVDSSSISLETFVEDLEEIRKAFELDKMNLMGHSWGGMLAMFYAIEYPENINSLMLISSGAGSSDFWNEFYANIDRKRTTEDSLALATLRASEGFKDRQIEPWEKFYNIFFRPFFYNQNLSDSLNMKFSETTVRNLPVIASSSLNETIRDFNIVDQLSIINSPAIIIHGENDVIPFKYAEEIHKGIDGSELNILKNCGHFPYIEKPDEFLGLVQSFLDKIVRD